MKYVCIDLVCIVSHTLVSLSPLTHAVIRAQAITDKSNPRSPISTRRLRSVSGSPFLNLVIKSSVSNSVPIGLSLKGSLIMNSLASSAVLKIVDLSLNHVTLRILIVDARGWSMINTPGWLDTGLESLSIRQQEVGQGREAKCNMLESAGLRILGLCAFDLHNGNAVMLFVIGDEGDEVVGVSDTAT